MHSGQRRSRCLGRFRSCVQLACSLKKESARTSIAVSCTTVSVARTAPNVLPLSARTGMQRRLCGPIWRAWLGSLSCLVGRVTRLNQYRHRSGCTRRIPLDRGTKKRSAGWSKADLISTTRTTGHTNALTCTTAHTHTRTHTNTHTPTHTHIHVYTNVPKHTYVYPSIYTPTYAYNHTPET